MITNKLHEFKLFLCLLIIGTAINSFAEDKCPTAKEIQDLIVPKLMKADKFTPPQINLNDRDWAISSKVVRQSFQDSNNMLGYLKNRKKYEEHGIKIHVYNVEDMSNWPVCKYEITFVMVAYPPGKATNHDIERRHIYTLELRPK